MQRQQREKKMLQAEVNNRIFIQKLPRKWTWDKPTGVACVAWEDGESFAFIGRELTDVVYTIPDLLAIDTLEDELKQASVPIDDIFKEVHAPDDEQSAKWEDWDDGDNYEYGE